MKRWTVAAVLLVLLVSVGTVACNPSGGGAEKDGPSGGGAEKDGQQVEAKLGDLAITVNGSGNIEISEERQLTFGSIGKINEIYVEKGDRVYNGEALAKLDTTSLELAVLKAEDAVEKAKRALEDANEPYDEVDKAVAESTLAAAESKPSPSCPVPTMPGHWTSNRLRNGPSSRQPRRS
jgi:multidrug efflux pump subunit AcrA (membrane-fusion protein)